MMPNTPSHQMLSFLGNPAAATPFEQGLLTEAVKQSGKDLWQRFAALGLLGLTGEAIAGLESFESDEAQFFLAAAHWINGDEDAAARILERLDLAPARRLLALLRKNRIEVLSFFPGSRPGPFVLADGGRYDPKFLVRNVSFNPPDVPNRLYADAHDLYRTGTPPDFLVCQMVE
jgi:hypothetical protein